MQGIRHGSGNALLSSCALLVARRRGGAGSGLGAPYTMGPGGVEVSCIMYGLHARFRPSASMVYNGPHA